MYTVHVISQNIDSGATEADGGASAPVGPSVATPMCMGTLYNCVFYVDTADSRSDGSYKVRNTVMYGYIM